MTAAVRTAGFLAVYGGLFAGIVRAGLALISWQVCQDVPAISCHWVLADVPFPLLVVGTFVVLLPALPILGLLYGWFLVLPGFVLLWLANRIEQRRGQSTNVH